MKKTNKRILPFVRGNPLPDTQPGSQDLSLDTWGEVFFGEARGQWKGPGNKVVRPKIEL